MPAYNDILQKINDNRAASFEKDVLNDFKTKIDKEWDALKPDERKDLVKACLVMVDQVQHDHPNGQNDLVVQAVITALNRIKGELFVGYARNDMKAISLLLTQLDDIRAKKQGASFTNIQLDLVEAMTQDDASPILKQALIDLLEVRNISLQGIPKPNRAAKLVVKNGNQDSYPTKALDRVHKIAGKVGAGELPAEMDASGNHDFTASKVVERLDAKVNKVTTRMETETRNDYVTKRVSNRARTPKDKTARTYDYSRKEDQELNYAAKTIYPSFAPPREVDLSKATTTAERPFGVNDDQVRHIDGKKVTKMPLKKTAIDPKAKPTDTIDVLDIYLQNKPALGNTPASSEIILNTVQGARKLITEDNKKDNKPEIILSAAASVLRVEGIIAACTQAKAVYVDVHFPADELTKTPLNAAEFEDLIAQIRDVILAHAIPVIDSRVSAAMLKYFNPKVDQVEKAMNAASAAGTQIGWKSLEKNIGLSQNTFTEMQKVMDATIQINTMLTKPAAELTAADAKPIVSEALGRLGLPSPFGDRFTDNSHPFHSHSTRGSI